MPQSYDAIIVGSGACGGWAAMALCQAGMKVLMLEAGKTLEPLAAQFFSDQILVADQHHLEAVFLDGQGGSFASTTPISV